MLLPKQALLGALSVLEESTFEDGDFFTKTVEKTKKTDYRDFSDVTSDSDCDPETLSFQIADPSDSSSESDAEIFSTADPCSSITADTCILSPVLSNSRLVFMLDSNFW